VRRKSCFFFCVAESIAASAPASLGANFAMAFSSTCFAIAKVANAVSQRVLSENTNHDLFLAPAGWRRTAGAPAAVKAEWTCR